ncbi:E3 ubiquitin/ISG15 ligase TRIM25 isoform X1 [Mastomys coucha]|uniref:E3 ubiquitin/ISG15 ligase TRIM25 isoform X1 n=1 Tax=Mastomys coucha TaxID=35658 RepID=UPI0012620AAF|nr:E3 ubiquitin/ISG15 ligase TRIM25 isoform X1 [Mastomys coucha]
MAELYLAEELMCSICLEPFKEPVTTPCGHNFCSSCLDETWVVQGPSYRCPQCRAEYRVRPQLQKNTVLCAVVEQFLQAEQARTPADDWTPPARSAASSSDTQVACDHCLKEMAVKTCLVCMASFCQEHLRPHIDSPYFQDHPLQPPVRDLLRRKCPQHNRLRELFCPEHSECICHMCLVEHKTCSPKLLSQASADLENKLRHKLSVMHSHINGATKALDEVKSKQQSVQDSIKRKMEQLRQEYVEIRAVVDAAEASSWRKLKEEENRVYGKLDTIYKVLLKKKNEMQSLKAEVELILVKGDEFEFLENKLRHKLSVMHSHINGATKALDEVKSKQQSVQDSMKRKMEQLRQEYVEIKAVVDAAEASSWRKLKEEENRVYGKLDTIYKVLLKKRNEMQSLKAEAELILIKGDEFEFLEKAAKLQEESTKPVFIPKIELDHDLIKGIYQGAVDLKRELKLSLKQVQEKKTQEHSGSDTPLTANTQFWELVPLCARQVPHHFYPL